MKEVEGQSELADIEKTHPGIPIYCDIGDPEMHDPARQQSCTVWRASNNISFKLLRCVEAVRDITKLLEGISQIENTLSNKRYAKMLATPLYSLVSGIKDIYNELEGNANEYPVVSTAQHKELQRRAAQFAKLVPTDKGSELRDVRDKMSSHIDKVTVETPSPYWEKVDLLRFLNWLRACIEQMMHLLALDVYGWTRDSGHPDIWSLMSVDGTVVDFYMQNGEPVSILKVTFAKSPKYGIANEVERLVWLYNEVTAKPIMEGKTINGNQTA